MSLQGRRSLLALTLAFGGCAGNAGLEAVSVLSYDQCQGIGDGLTRVSYADVAGIRGSTLLDLSAPDAAGPQGEDDVLLVAISRGQQPTPGYRLTLEGAHRREDTAVIEVHWSTPESGAVLAQVMTHPCLVVGLSADVARVEAVDQTGADLGSLTL